MPSETVTAASLAWVGGEITTNTDADVLTTARLYWTGGEVTDEVAGGIKSTPKPPPVLDRFTPFQSLTNQDGTPAVLFMSLWQEHCKKIEDALASQQVQITDLSTIVARLEQAETKAEAASVQAATTASAKALESSYTDAPANPLSAAATGIISIMAHTRIYPGGADNGGDLAVAVNAGTITGRAAGVWNVYYSDAAKSGGAVSYEATQSNVAQTGSTHLVGQVSVPEVGLSDTTGTPVRAPGGIDPQYFEAYEAFNPRY